MANVEVVSLCPNEMLFEIGNADENIFILQSGILNLFRSTKDVVGETETCILKQVLPGDSIFSGLSFVQSMGRLKMSSRPCLPGVKLRIGEACLTSQ